MFGLTTMGKRRPSVAAARLGGPVDDAGFGVGEPERVEQGQLAGLRELGAEGGEAVEDADAAGFEVLEEAGV